MKECHNQVLPGGVSKPTGFRIVTVLVVTRQVVESHLSLDWVLVRTQVHLASVGLATRQRDRCTGNVTFLLRQLKTVCR